MLRSAPGKLMWLERTRVLVVGLAVILAAALTIGVEAASAATVQQLAAAWGGNDRGQLGNGISGSGTDSNRPVGVGGGLNATNIKALDGGNDYSLALRNDGTVWAWGRNNVGELGNGTFTTTGCNCINTPVQVVDPSDPSGFLQGVTAIAAGGDHNLALKSDGTVVAWGANNTGQLGNGTNGFGATTTPVAVSNLSGVKAIAGGGNLSLALKTDGTVRSWGANDADQLGNGSNAASSNVPVTVSNLKGVRAISAGGNYALALKKSKIGTVVSAWGGNNSGQLGNGESVNSSNTPVVVRGLKGVKAVSAGGDFGSGNHSLALKTDGTVVAWGANGNGQLGNGDDTFSNSNVPVRVINLGGVTAIAAGGYHSLAM